MLYLVALVVVVTIGYWLTKSKPYSMSEETFLSLSRQEKAEAIERNLVSVSVWVRHSVKN